jgi:hypothetical protein
MPYVSPEEYSALVNARNELSLVKLERTNYIQNCLDLEKSAGAIRKEIDAFAVKKWGEEMSGYDYGYQKGLTDAEAIVGAIITNAHMDFMKRKRG